MQQEGDKKHAFNFFKTHKVFIDAKSARNVLLERRSLGLPGYRINFTVKMDTFLNSIPKKTLKIVS